MSLYVDGCCNKKIGSCCSVVDETSQDMISLHHDFLNQFDFLDWFILKKHNERLVYEVNFNDVVSQQNNGAELLAMLIGLMIALKFDYKIIYSDSQLIVDYWSLKKSEKIKDSRKLKIQIAVIKLRKEFERRSGQIIKISGNDNLADLGFHVNK